MKDTFILSAADRLITQNGTPIGTRKKLLSIPYLNATVSYYGLASFVSGSKEWEMAEYLRRFIRRNVAIDNLGDFSKTLRDELMESIPHSLLKKNHSGFHICGYGKGRLPEFWHLNNIGAMKDFVYVDCQNSYRTPTEDFLGRDAINTFGWKSGTFQTETNGIQRYRNGDIRAHIVLWDKLDEGMLKLFEFRDFSEPTNEKEYGLYCKFKLQVISRIYKNWASHKIIGGPIDVIVIRCRIDRTGKSRITITSP